MKSTKNKFIIPLLGIIALGAVYLVMSNDNSSQNSISAMPEQSLYSVQLNDMVGNEKKMSEDKITFLNVWATWCGPCNMEMPSIQNLYAKYKDHPKVEFLIVSDEAPSVVTPFLERKGYNLPFYQYTSQFPTALDGNSIPRTYIIHKGEILVEEVGASQWDRPEVVNLIEQKLAEI